MQNKILCGNSLQVLNFTGNEPEHLAYSKKIYLFKGVLWIRNDFLQIWVRILILT